VIKIDASAKIKTYFDGINDEIKKAFSIATKAREKKYDPVDFVEVTLAKNMAERVIGLISVVAPQIKGAGAEKRIIELEKKYGVLDWRVALQIALEISQEKFCKFKNKKEAMEVGIRTGFAYSTVGVVSSPLEGFVGLDLIDRLDGRGKYFRLNFSGPIRNAGGTNAAVSVLIADYVRKKMGYAEYDPTEEEVKRTFTEIEDYHERVTNLQYFPSKEEVEFLMRNMPVQISGDPSEKYEVSNYKDLPRIPTNFLRSGFCLIHSSCVPLKAPKLWKQLNKWGKDFDLDHWNFLKDFLKIQKKAKALGSVNEAKDKIIPVYTYITDIVAGRPVLGHPLRHGGFRLRYGRSRVSGYSSMAIHPATMHVLDGYIAVATHIKVERPSKGAALTSCDLIEGPVVQLEDGSVIKLENEEEAKKMKNKITKILFLGDLLISYGDFLNRAHRLLPPGYCEEWWVQEVERAVVDVFGSLDLNKLANIIEVDEKRTEYLIKNYLLRDITYFEAKAISQRLNVPLHPKFLFFWDALSYDDLYDLISNLGSINIFKENGRVVKFVIPANKAKIIFEKLCLPHKLVSKEFVVVEGDTANAFLDTLNLIDKESVGELLKKLKDYESVDIMDVINDISDYQIRPKAGVFIGARMGRPEKAKMRKLTGSPQVLFPVGEEGGRLRSIQSALDVGKVKADFPIFYCSDCDRETIFSVCEACDKPTEKRFFCSVCGLIDKPECEKHGQASTYRCKEIDIRRLFNHILKKLSTNSYPDLIKGVRGTSNKDHVPEHLIKGVLRAKYGLFVNKDGTIRYDASEVGITHFRPKEIGTTIEKLKQLGYTTDVSNRPLESEDQLLEIFPQDVILPSCPVSPDEDCADILFRSTKFIDELLVKLYGLEPYYNLNDKADLVGQLIVGLAPHTSAGIVGRIIGFSKTQGFFANPIFHAAMRRDLDGDESCVFLLLDAFLNFSKIYLPNHRGATMDAPLVLTSVLNPSEVDDMVFDMDIVSRYPLEFYEACIERKMPWDAKIKKIGDVLGTKEQFEGLTFTHDTKNINKGVLCSAYKLLPSMEEKLRGQMNLAEKLVSVVEADVAKLVVEKHFLKDIKGNLRKFSQQVFRCVKCNEKYRRPPLTGKCAVCGGKIIFTVSEGSIVKYLEPSISLANKYEVPAYLKQTLLLLRRNIDQIFGREKEKQTGLGKWFG